MTDHNDQNQLPLQKANSFLYCHNCGSQISENYKFCSACGSALKIIPKNTESAPSTKKILNTKLIACVLSLSTALYLSAYYLNPALIGKAPASSHATKTSTVPQTSEDLFAQAENAIKNISQSDSPTSSQLLEAVDLLSRILQAEPDNPWALIQMAELSFNQKMFDKSSDFYARYLQTNPDDLTIRSRYASSLTFAGNTEQAIKELDTVLEKSPENFQALAFAAIANHEAGNSEKARTFINKAINLAPSEEAKNRLLKFSGGINQEQSTTGTTAGGKELSSIANNNLESYLKQHPIAGPKFVKMEITGSVVYLDFKDFPMDKMPPVVKDKFINNIVSEASKNEDFKAKKIIFRDSTSGSVMSETSAN